jgi:hypothetical protein
MAAYLRVLMVVAMLVPAAQAQVGTVTGQLLNDRGLPAAGVRVAAMPVPREGDTNAPTLAGLTLTDSNGRYTIETLEPGTYYVTAGRVDSPSYYPGVGAVSAAKSILVAAGAIISGIDFKTVQPLTHVVSGKVVLQPGQKLVPGSAPPRMILTGAASLEAPLSSDGNFEFSRLQPGQYTLRLSADAFSVPMPVAVEGRVTGIEFRPAAVSVSGSVVTEGDGDAPTVSVSFLNIRQNRLMEVAASRAFAFFASEGEFRVTAKRVPAGYQVKSLTAGGVDLLTNSLKLSSTEPVVAIALTLKAAPAVAFAGRAISPLGLLRQMGSIRMENGGEPLQGVVQPDGSFVFDRIAPGEYTAVISVAGSEEFKTKVTVPPDGHPDAAIVIPELRQLSVKLGVEGNVPAAARPLVTLRFVDDAGDIVPLAIDRSLGETPLMFSLRDGRYQVTATIRESVAGAGTTRVKSLTAGPLDLLTSPLSVAGSVDEIRITIGR